ARALPAAEIADLRRVGERGSRPRRRARSGGRRVDHALRDEPAPDVGALEDPLRAALVADASAREDAEHDAALAFRDRAAAGVAVARTCAARDLGRADVLERAVTKEPGDARKAANGDVEATAA